MMDTDHKQLWENVLVNIELSVSKANFSTWFKDTYIARQEDNTVYVGVPNEFVRDWLSTKHSKFILRELRSLIPEVRGVEFVVGKSGGKRKEERQKPRMADISLNRALPLEEYYISRNDNLNPRYVFDTFVVGPFNELAHAAAFAVVNRPGITYNPLFVYGGTGLGKTHLIQAVGNALKKTGGKKVFYVTSERFTVDYVNALQNGTVNNFKDKYRQYDTLVMDDVQFLSQKEKTQEELFHLFNALYDNNKQIVFSSDKHPSYIPNMEERLKSRFSQGMIVDISQPDHESRIAILKSKAAHNNFTLSDDTAEYIAAEVQGNIRDLEGILNSVICQSQLKGKDLSISDLKNLIKTTANAKKLISTKEIVRRIADFYDVDEQSIYEKTRKKEVVKPRQLIMYILREDFHISYPTIGQKLGGRDHTTVIHSCEKIKQNLEEDNVLAQEINHIRTLLK
jgi:chromosomal replication initiator protein